MKLVRILLMSICCIPLFVEANGINVNYKDDAKKLLKEAGVKVEDPLTTQNYKSYLEKKRFEEIDKNKDSKLSLLEFSAARLDCGINSGQFKCEKGRDVESQYRSLKNGGDFTIQTLQLQHTLWKAIFNNATKEFFGGQTSLNLDQVAGVIRIQAEKSHIKSRLRSFNNLLNNTTLPVSIEQWVWESLFLKLDTNFSDTVDYFEFKEKFESPEALKDFEKIVNASPNGKTSGLVPKTFFIGSSSVQPNSGPNVPSIKTIKSHVYETNAGLYTDTNGKNSTEVRGVISDYLVKLDKLAKEKWRKENPRANVFSLPYVPDRGFLLIGDASYNAKTEKIEADWSKDVVTLRVLKDFTTNDSNAEAASFSYEKKEGASHNSIEAALRLDWYKKEWWESDFASTRVAFGLSRNRSGDGLKNQLTDDKTVFLLIDSIFIHDNSFLIGSNLTFGPKYSKIHTRETDKETEVVTIKNQKKVSGLIQWEPLLNLGFTTTTVSTPFSNTSQWSGYIRPRINLQFDNVQEEKMIPISDDEEATTGPIDDRNYINGSIELGMNYDDKISFSYKFTLWQELGDSENDFNFHEFSTEWKFAGYEHIVLKASYKEGISEPSSVQQESYNVSLGILF